ncbi:MAG: hypothetical protein JWM16_6262 [Verrucomicrobiales bacterium]|nr:hypothetical protein [Verrucomicrobiales bacterium]
MTPSFLLPPTYLSVQEQRLPAFKKSVPINVDTPLRSNRFPLYQISKFEPLRTRQLLGRVLLSWLGRKTIHPCGLYRPGCTLMFQVLWNSTM